MNITLVTTTTCTGDGPFRGLADNAAPAEVVEESAKLEWRPNLTVALDEDGARSVLKLIDILDDHDDVQTVTANFEVDDAVLQKLSA